MGLPIPTYNAPVTLTFALMAFAIRVLDMVTGKAFTYVFFSLPPHFQWNVPFNYPRLITHVFGHRDFGHLTANFAIILLIGPILEEKYGSRRLLIMGLITALATGIMHALFFSSGLLGASGIVFMLILLGSFTNHKRGEIPLTFILVVVLYLAKEIMGMFQNDDIAQSAHLVGGLLGGLFGYLGGVSGRKGSGVAAKA
jgi:membrane associated rhomboid family serine protease